jgi:pimeloyl-ACP methyl ester carboxylesterase
VWLHEFPNGWAIVAGSVPHRYRQGVWELLSGCGGLPPWSRRKGAKRLMDKEWDRARLAMRYPIESVTMPLIHHVVTGQGRPPIVFVHGFGCAHSDWDAQVAHLSPRCQTVAVDLRGHGASPGTPDQCSIEQHGTDVAEVMEALALPPAVLVGHSMGCRVVIEAALRAPTHTGAVVLIDGSQFAPSMEVMLKEAFALPDGMAVMARRWFQEMFTAKSNHAVIAAIQARVGRLPRQIGEKMLTDLVRYDVGRLSTALTELSVPVMAIQTTYSNEKRERRSMGNGQTTPYLDMLRANIPSVRIEIIAETGHFPQIDEPAQTTTLIESFIATLLTS